MCCNTMKHNSTPNHVDKCMYVVADGVGECPSGGKLTCIKDTFMSLLKLPAGTFPAVSDSSGDSVFESFNPTFLAQAANGIIDTAVTALTCVLPIFNGSEILNPAFKLSLNSGGACGLLPVDPTRDYVVGVLNSTLAFPSDLSGNGTLDNIRKSISSRFSKPFAICMAANPCDGLGKSFRKRYV